MLLQHSLDYDAEAVRMSNVDGLNLNIFVPASDGASANNSLPVFVFIHGKKFLLRISQQSKVFSLLVELFFTYHSIFYEQANISPLFFVTFTVLVK
ncbi:MAG: hypothetical protein EOP48_16805 [Sphingobacteriales bacterium]|nr:MAG: hypothetical protein EOP48_16805 [Sphingobacteriales bacterium]